MLHTIIIHRSFFFFWGGRSIPDHTQKYKTNPFSCHNIPLRSGKKKQTTTLGLASHWRNDKGLWSVIIAPVHWKTPYFALCCIMSSGCDLSSTLQLIVWVRVTVTPWIDLMVLFVTNKPLIELICLINDGVDLKLYQNTYLLHVLWQSKKKNRQQKYIFLHRFSGNLVGKQRPGARTLE